ncbi:MAG: tetratricopeptide repeat protein, partial [Proteobacteria bacterium]|nr:tetratricopeptide repeat protein [Pseudomonadota bacterium]
MLVTFAAYVPAFNAGYVCDDNIFLYENPLIQAPNGLYRIWCTTEQDVYFPLTYTMVWLEWRIAGNNPVFYHAMNILLHALASVLLWLVLKKLKVPGAYLAGLIFAVHPVAAASVAWITERKNTLSMVLYLLSILAWLRFEDAGRKRAYLGAVLLFVAATLAKTSVVMLPVVLLLLAWWKRGRISRQDVLRVIPFFAVSLALAVVNLWVHTRSLDTLVIPYSSRLAASGWIVWFYLYKVLLPVNLMMIYPKWQVDGGNPASYLPLVLLGAAIIALWLFRKGWGKGLLLAMAYFLVSLFPVMGFFKMSFAQHSLVSDHLQYVAMTGIIAILAAGAAMVVKRLQISTAVSRLCAMALVLLLGTLTWFQCGTFKDTETLFTYNIAKNDKAWGAYYSLGIALTDRGQIEEAIAQYRKALEIKPDEAIGHYLTALEIRPNDAEAHNNLGEIFGDRGMVDEALAHYRRALTINPGYA